MTESGFIGFAPDGSVPGDVIVAFHGAETQSVLRRAHTNTPHKPWRDKASRESNISTGNQGWELVGECYLHGFMTNEILRPELCSQRQTFFLL